MSLFPEFVFQKQGKSAIWADPKVLANIGPDLIANPDLLFARADCKIIKDQLKIKVGHINLKIDGIVTGIYIKRYNTFSIRYRIASLVLRSGAVKSLRGARILSQAGIATSKPLAVIEVRSRGMLDSSFFLSEEIVLGKTADRYWRETLARIRGIEGFRCRRNFLRNLAKLFRQLHQGRIYHNDLKDANIFVAARVAGEERFFLLDLEGVRSCWYIPKRRRIKNLVQLNRTLGKLLTRSRKLSLLKTYLGRDYCDRNRMRRWALDICRESDRMNRRSLRKTTTTR